MCVHMSGTRGGGECLDWGMGLWSIDQREPLTWNSSGVTLVCCTRRGGREKVEGRVYAPPGPSRLQGRFGHISPALTGLTRSTQKNLGRSKRETLVVHAGHLRLPYRAELFSPRESPLRYNQPLQAGRQRRCCVFPLRGQVVKLRRTTQQQSPHKTPRKSRK